MSAFETASVTVSAEARNQDRFAVLEFAERLVLVVADGAGGSGGGEEAAEAVVREVTFAASVPHNAGSWAMVLQQTDFRIGRGESTCVVAELSAGRIEGASVGDSCAWLLQDGDLFDLSRNQIRKPLLGSGAAQPISFSSAFSRGLLILSTDGFSKYVKQQSLLQTVNWIDFLVLPRKLVEMVRLPSGQLWDDVTIVACRPRRGHRKKYTLSDANS